MAMYIAITLLAVSVADTSTPKAWDDVALILGTVIGVVAAHLLAFRLASRLFAPSVDATVDQEDQASLLTILAAACGVTLIAILPYGLLPPFAASNVSMILLSFIIGFGAWRTARAAGASSSRAIGYTALITIVALAIALLKGWLTK